MRADPSDANDKGNKHFSDLGYHKLSIAFHFDTDYPEFMHKILDSMASPTIEEFSAMHNKSTIRQEFISGLALIRSDSHRYFSSSSEGKRVSGSHNFSNSIFNIKMTGGGEITKYDKFLLQKLYSDDFIS